MWGSLSLGGVGGLTRWCSVASPVAGLCALMMTWTCGGGARVDERPIDAIVAGMHAVPLRPVQSATRAAQPAPSTNQPTKQPANQPTNQPGTATPSKRRAHPGVRPAAVRAKHKRVGRLPAHIAGPPPLCVRQKLQVCAPAAVRLRDLDLVLDGEPGGGGGEGGGEEGRHRIVLVGCGDLRC